MLEADVEGRIMNEPEALLDVWAQHFGKLTKSNVNESDGLKVLQQKMDTLASESVSNEEYVLDVPFSDEEVAMAVWKLKGRKAVGPDSLIGEHLKEGRQPIVVWLRNILNSVVELEVVPGAMKSGVVVPVYKGGGKDPLKVDSY